MVCKTLASGRLRFKLFDPTPFIDSIPGEQERLKSPARRRRSRFERPTEWVPSSKLEQHSVSEIPNPVSIKPTDDGSEDSDEESLQGKHKKLPLEEIKGIEDRSKMTKSSLDEVKIEDSEPDEPETLNFMGKLRRTFNRLTAWIPGTRSSQLEQHSVSEIPNTSSIKPTGTSYSDVGLSDDTQEQKEAEGMINNPGYHEESSRPEVEIVLTNCLGTQAAKFSHPDYDIELILEDNSLEHEIKKQVVVKPEIKIVECSQDRDSSRTHEELLALSSEDVSSESTSTFMAMPIVYGPSEATFHPDRPAKLRFFAGYLEDLQNELREEGNDHCSNEDVKKHLRAVYEPLISADGHNWRMLPPVDVIFESGENEDIQVWLQALLYHFSEGSIAKLLPKLKAPKYEIREHLDEDMPLWRRVVKHRGQAMLGNATKENIVYYACKLSNVTDHHARTEGGESAVGVQLSGARERGMTLHHHGLDPVMKYEVSPNKYKTVDVFMDGPVVQRQILVGVFLRQQNGLAYLGRTHLRVGRVYAVLPKMIDVWRKKPAIFKKTFGYDATPERVSEFIRTNL